MPQVRDVAGEPWLDGLRTMRDRPDRIGSDRTRGTAGATGDLLSATTRALLPAATGDLLPGATRRNLLSASTESNLVRAAIHVSEGGHQAATRPSPERPCASGIGHPADHFACAADCSRGARSWILGDWIELRAGSPRCTAHHERDNGAGRPLAGASRRLECPTTGTVADGCAPPTLVSAGARRAHCQSHSTHRDFENSSLLSACSIASFADDPVHATRCHRAPQSATGREDTVDH